MWTEFEYNDELYHHGIKGQKWGRRRFQDETGKLTAAGKERYKAYKSDYKTAVKLNRHVAASQKHLKEEGVMLDRVRDKYLKTNRDYQRSMTRSNGLFGSKSAEKAERVARAQLKMDKARGDLNNAAGAYGVAKKFANEDSKALKDHVDKMIRNYGKTSIGSIETETVKMGQSKAQKLLHGAPMSIILNKERMTENMVKTGKTLADMPIVGNFYTARYISRKEMSNDLNSIDRTINSKDAKRYTGNKDKDPKYLNPDYFDGVSSNTKSNFTRKMDKARKKYEDAENDYRFAEQVWERQMETKSRARNSMNIAKEQLDSATIKRKRHKLGSALVMAPLKPVSAAKVVRGRARDEFNYRVKKKAYDKRASVYQRKIDEQNDNANKILDASNKVDEAAYEYYKLRDKQRKRSKKK